MVISVVIRLVSGMTYFCCDNSDCPHLSENGYCNFRGMGAVTEVPFCDGAEPWWRLSSSTTSASSIAIPKRRMSATGSSDGTRRSTTESVISDRSAGAERRSKRSLSSSDSKESRLKDKVTKRRSAGPKFSTLEPGVWTPEGASQTAGTSSTRWPISTTMSAMAGLCDCRPPYKLVNDTCVDMLRLEGSSCHMFTCTGAEQGCLLEELSKDLFSVVACVTQTDRESCTVVVQRNMNGSVTERAGCTADCVARRGSNTTVSCCQGNYCNTNTTELLRNATLPENTATELAPVRHTGLVLTVLGVMFVFVYV